MKNILYEGTLICHKSGLFFNFGHFRRPWIRIRILISNTVLDPNPVEPNQCGSMRVRIQKHCLRLCVPSHHAPVETESAFWYQLVKDPGAYRARPPCEKMKGYPRGSRLIPLRLCVLTHCAPIETESAFWKQLVEDPGVYRARPSMRENERLPPGSLLSPSGYACSLSVHL
jgi:hypothetical protein